jgi:hypothetical protein
MADNGRYRTLALFQKFQKALPRRPCCKKMFRNLARRGLAVPGLRYDLPSVFILDQQQHLNPAVHLGVILSDFASGNRDGYVAKRTDFRAEHPFVE